MVIRKNSLTNFGGCDKNLGMELKTYLANEKKRAYVFAHEANVSPWSIYRILRGARPGPDVALKIQRATRDAVRVEDLIK